MKVAIATGGGGPGSGRAIARRFARDGAAVVVSDVDVEGGTETLRLIEKDGGNAAFFRADVGVEADIWQLTDFAEKAFGGIDVLVNNASFPYHPQNRFEYWLETIQVDLTGVMH